MNAPVDNSAQLSNLQAKMTAKMGTSAEWSIGDGTSPGPDHQRSPERSWSQSVTEHGCLECKSWTAGSWGYQSTCRQQDRSILDISRWEPCRLSRWSRWWCLRGRSRWWWWPRRNRQRIRWWRKYCVDPDSWDVGERWAQHGRADVAGPGRRPRSPGGFSDMQTIDDPGESYNITVVEGRTGGAGLEFMESFPASATTRFSSRCLPVDGPCSFPRCPTKNLQGRQADQQPHPCLDHKSRWLRVMPSCSLDRCGRSIRAGPKFLSWPSSDVWWSCIRDSQRRRHRPNSCGPQPRSSP